MLSHENLFFSRMYRIFTGKDVLNIPHPQSLESTQCGAETTRTFFWSPSNKKTNSISKMKKQRALRHRTQRTRFHRCFRNLCLWAHIFTLQSTVTATSIKVFTSLWRSRMQQTLGCSWIVKSVRISFQIQSKRLQKNTDEQGPHNKNKPLLELHSSSTGRMLQFFVILHF